MARDVEARKPPMLLCMGLKICLDEDFYGLLAGVHFHSDRCVAKIYLMATTVLPSNNRMCHFPLPLKAWRNRKQRALDSRISFESQKHRCCHPQQRTTDLRSQSPSGKRASPMKECSARYHASLVQELNAE